jgi:hypothetical protein
MGSPRKTALVAGVLFIITFVTSIRLTAEAVADQEVRDDGVDVRRRNS